MNWGPYAEYVPTGFTEVGDAPAEWEPIRLRRVLSVNPLVPIELRRAPEKEVTFLPMELIGEDGTLELTRTRPVGELLTGYSYFANGDVVFAKVTPCFENGKGAVVESLPSGHAFGTSEVTTLRPNRRLVEQFLGYLTRSDRFRQTSIAAMTGAGGLRRVPDEHVRDFPFALPPVAEQNAIVAFLDRETAKIDALIGKQEQLIATLREDRIATITHAVTKGLNPDAEMKDSGVEWLGDVPTHWSVRPVSSASRLVQTGPFGSQLHASDYIDDGTPIINPSHIVDGKIAPHPNQAVRTEKAAELSRHRLIRGDVITARRGELGRCAVVETDSEGFLCGTGSLLIRLNDGKLSPSYFWYFFGSSANRERLSQISAGSTMDNLNAQMVARLKVCWPPLREQEKIVRFLDHRCSRIDALIKKAQEVVETLGEFRSALITDAVTGKIDVRAVA